MVGRNGSSTCPTESLPIDSAGECQAAAHSLGWPWKRDETDAAYPKGCYATSIEGGGTGVFFNKHSVGSAQPKSTVLCQQSGCIAHACIVCVSGPKIQAHRCTDAQTHRYIHAYNMLLHSPFKWVSSVCVAYKSTCSAITQVLTSNRWQFCLQKSLRWRSLMWSSTHSME